MMRDILFALLFIPYALFAMGDSVNYDEKFNREEIKEVDTLLDNRLGGVTVNSYAFKEVNGKNIPVKHIQAGSKVVYINKVVNSNSDTKRSIVVRNPIPIGTEYVRGSALCNGGCEISYSTDGGTTLSKKELRGKKYNYLEFYFKEIPPFKEYRMGFRAIVEDKK